MISAHRAIFEQQRWSVVDSDQNIHSPVVVEVPYSHTTGRKSLPENWTPLGANIFQGFSCVTEKQERFPVSHVGRVFFDPVIRMAIGDKQIVIAVIVVIKKLCSPTTHKTGHGRHAEYAGLIAECFIVIVVVKRVHFLITFVTTRSCQPS